MLLSGRSSCGLFRRWTKTCIHITSHERCPKGMCAPTIKVVLILNHITGADSATFTHKLDGIAGWLRDHREEIYFYVIVGVSGVMDDVFFPLSINIMFVFFSKKKPIIFKCPTITTAFVYRSHLKWSNALLFFHLTSRLSNQTTNASPEKPWILSGYSDTHTIQTLSYRVQGTSP